MPRVKPIKKLPPKAKPAKTKARASMSPGRINSEGVYVKHRTVESRTRKPQSQATGTTIKDKKSPTGKTSIITSYTKTAGATDVSGTKKRKPTSRGSGRKTVVSGDPVKSRKSSATKRSAKRLAELKQQFGTPKKRITKKSSRRKASSYGI
jgi:hypothetical protein